jgi:tyrosine-protein phosphatase YwqE
MTDDMLKEIIPMIGHRAKFRAILEEWRKVIALANNQVIYQVSNIFLYILLYLEVK